MGLRAKGRLATLARLGHLEVEPHGQDLYRRTLARVYVGGRDLGRPWLRDACAPTSKQGE
jgi:endonuclease YncB( thermonuclease family)